jgi:hypothetical protein
MLGSGVAAAKREKRQAIDLNEMTRAIARSPGGDEGVGIEGLVGDQSASYERERLAALSHHLPLDGI